MRPSPRSIIPHVLLTIPCVLAQSTSLSTVLPPLLIDVIPSCSASCLEYFVILNYPPYACPNTQDIDCLCLTDTTTGFTLGEAALRCVVSSCPEQAGEITEAYSLCSSVPNALPATHSTITATLMATTAFPVSSTLSTATGPVSSALPSSLPNPSISFSGTGIAVDTGTPAAFPSFPSNLSSASTSRSTSVMASPEPASASSPSPHPNGSLSTPQIVGIVMAGVASAAVAFGALLFIYCLRRKRRLKRQSDQLPFQIEKSTPKAARPPTRPEEERNLGLNIGGEDIPVSNPNQVFAAPQPDKRRSFWRKSINPEEIGVAVSPETKQDSPASFASTRTASKLLPEKPSYSLFPAPLRISRQPTRPASTATVFEVDYDPSRRSYVPPTVVSRGQAWNPAPQWLPYDYYENLGQAQSDPRTMMYAAERAANFPTPATSIAKRSIVQAAGTQNRSSQAPNSPQQSRPQLRRLDPPFEVAQMAPSSTYSGKYSLPPSKPRNSLVIPAQQPSRKTNYHRTQNVRDSHASDTSFEFDDEETPTEQRNQRQKSLSTVNESPIKQSSPISDLRYPRLPRPASMTKNAALIPRPLKPGIALQPAIKDQPRSGSRQPRPRNRQEPPLFRGQLSSSSSRDDSPSSLLAKRRGDQAAEIIERGLRLRPDINTPAGQKWKVIKKEAVKTPASARISPPRRGPRTPPELSRENSDETYGTPRHRNDRAAAIYANALRSPTWEPKLTPTRRGNDLFISVERE